MPYNFVMSVDIRALRYFSTVAMRGSFSRAAEQLHVAQPALSLQVRRLEESLGTRLLERQPRGVALTPSGEKFLAYADDILRRLEAACDDMRASAAEPVGTVSVGMPQSMAKLLTVPLVRQALRRWPKVALRMVELNTGYVPEFIAAGRIDIGLVFFAQTAHPLRMRHLVDEELVVVGPAGRFARLDRRSWSRAGQVSLAEIARLPLVLPMTLHSLRELIETYTQRRRLRLNVVAEVNAIPQLIDLVGEGIGYTILSYPSVREAIARGEVSAARIHQPPITRPVYLCRSASVPPTHAVAAMEALVVETADALVRSGHWPATLASRPEPAG